MVKYEKLLHTKVEMLLVSNHRHRQSKRLVIASLTPKLTLMLAVCKTRQRYQREKNDTALLYFSTPAVSADCPIQMKEATFFTQG